MSGQAAPADPVSASRRAMSARSSIIREILRLTQRGDVLSLAGGIPAAEAVPLATLREVAGGLPAEAWQYTPTEGYPPLRAVLAAHAAAELGRAVAEDEIVVTSGSQQALDLLGRALLDPGDLVAMEHPGYLGAIQALEAYEPRFLPVPVDDGGLDIERLEAALAGGARPKLVYTVPNFSNPSGATLSAERRAALAALADRYGFLLVEDDPYGHLRFRGEPLPPLSASSDRVVRLRTVSKTIAPGLRVGWVVAPRALVGLLVRGKQAADLQASTVGQAIAAELLGRPGWVERQIRGIVPHYAERAAALVEALHRELGEALTVREPHGGMFVWGTLTAAATDAAALLPRAIARGVAFVPGSAFAVPGGESLAAGLRLSYATLDAPRLREAAQRLAAAVGDSPAGDD